MEQFWGNLVHIIELTTKSGRLIDEGRPISNFNFIDGQN